MKSWAGDILETIENSIASKSYKGIMICTVKSVKPLVLTYNELDIGKSEGDFVYVHPLFIGVPIEQDIEALKESQNFKSSTAYNSPNFEGIIEGSIPDFLKDFYLFYKNWQTAYLLAPEDKVIVFQTEDNSYIVLQKVILDELENEGGEQNEF